MFALQARGGVLFIEDYANQASRGWSCDGEFGCGGEELAGIGLAGCGAEGLGIAGFDEATALHDGDARGEIADERHGVGDEEISEAVVALEGAEEVDNLRADGDIECGDGLVEDKQARAQGEGAGDVDALALAAGELMRIAREGGFVQADFRKQLYGAGAARGAGAIDAGGLAVDGEGLGEDVEDLHAGVERGVGVLEDGLHLAAERVHLAAGGAGELDAVDTDGAGGGRDEAEDHARNGGFARAGFADEAEGFSGGDGERDTIDDGVVLDARADAARIAFGDGIEFDDGLGLGRAFVGHECMVHGRSVHVAMDGTGV